MIHPHTRLHFIDDDIGYGIFATESIPAGTITYVKDALEIDLHSSHEMLSLQPTKTILKNTPTVKLLAAML